MRTALALVVAAVALSGLAGPMRALAEPSPVFNYVYEIWYEVERDMGSQLDLYFAKLKELPGSRSRWVDTHNEGNGRVVSFPAAQLGDYRGARQNEAGLRAMLGDLAYRELTKSYAEAQLSRRSYIRQYRSDLSLNRAHYSRAGLSATEYVLVTIEPGKEKQFERLWRTAVGAYAKVFPHTVLVTAKTVVGGGPQYAVTRPLRARTDLESLPTASEAVRLALGPAESKAFNDRFSESVNKWEALVLVPTGLDADGTVPAGTASK